MRILFAAPDRDLLECYKAILEADGNEVTIAFDGAAALSLLTDRTFEVVILDRDIPRVEHSRIAARATEKNVPVIILSPEPEGEQGPSGKFAQSAYLSYPFDPEKLESVISDVTGKAEAEKKGFESVTEYE